MSKNKINQEIIDFVNSEAKKFESGELQAPKNKEEYKQMVK